MILEDKFNQLHAFMMKIKEELREELRLASPGATIGISFDDEVMLNRIPSTQIVFPGQYIREEKYTVEVIRQEQDIVYFEVPETNEESIRLGFMDASTFLSVFTIVPPAKDYGLGLPLPKMKK